MLRYVKVIFAFPFIMLHALVVSLAIMVELMRDHIHEEMSFA